MQGPYFSIISSHGNGFRIALSYDISLAGPKSNGHVFAFKKLIYLQPETELPREEIDISVLNYFTFEIYVSALSKSLFYDEVWQER